MQSRERGGYPDSEVEGGATSDQRVLTAHGMQLRGRGEPQTKSDEGGHPLGNMRSPRTA